jgi:hypothetical protein
MTPIKDANVAQSITPIARIWYTAIKMVAELILTS